MTLKSIILEFSSIMYLTLIRGISLPGVTKTLPVVSLYADEASVVALSDAAIHDAFHIYAKFAVGTGTKLNLGKCEGLWLRP